MLDHVISLIMTQAETPAEIAGFAGRCSRRHAPWVGNQDVGSGY